MMMRYSLKHIKNMAVNGKRYLNYFKAGMILVNSEQITL